MMTLPRLAAESLEKLLGSFMRRRYDESSARVVEGSTRTAMECIGNSDALYHNIEHTMLVTLADSGDHAWPQSARAPDAARTTSIS